MTIRVVASSDTSIVIEFGDHIDRQLSDQVLAAHFAVDEAGISGVVELVPTFRSLMIHYDPLVTSANVLMGDLKPLLASQQKSHRVARLWDIPACYDGAAAPDLESVAQATRMSTDEIIGLHMSETYHVYMIGFLPGYPYMGDVSEALQLPRRKEPRIRVPKGAIAIATSMTAVYPTESPGGWHLIGSTPVAMFNSAQPQPALLAPGDKVRFRRISIAEHETIEGDVRKGTYTPSVKELPS